MIKVLQLIHGLNMGGAETLVKDYALGYDKSKIDLTVLCHEHRNSPYEQILEDAGIKVIYVCDETPFAGRQEIWAKAVNRIFVAFKIRKYIHQIVPDVIHEHLILNTYLKFARPRKGTVLFYTQHFQVDRWMKAFPWEIRSVRWLLRHYPMRILALNDSMKTEIQCLVGDSYKKNVLVLHNGVDWSRFREAKDGKTVRVENQIPLDAFVAGHVGRFSAIKNHTFLVEIFEEIARKREDAFLLLVGEGETMPEVREQLKKRGLLERSMILSRRTDVQDLMRAMDILVFPSTSEGLGTVLIEAQMAQLRCMVSASVPRETQISNLIRYKSLEEPARAWAHEILAWEQENVQYDGAEAWDLCRIIRRLEQLYEECLQEAEMSEKE